MRWGYTDLRTQFLENTGNPGSTDTTLIAFFDRNLGPKYQLILAELANHKTQPPAKTASTVADQVYYHYPPDVVDIENVQVTVNSVDYPLETIHSQSVWNWLNSLTIQTSAIPQFIFPRRDDFGIWPTPQDAYTITFDYHMRDRNLTVADYITGTVTVTQNSATITGSSTTFTANMVGRWFQVTTNTLDSYWYRITSFTSTTVIVLESVYEGASGSGLSYKIIESPEIPEEGHILLADGVTAEWYAGTRGDIAKATWWNNKFWTGDGNKNSRSSEDTNGGLIGLKKRYASRSNSRIIRRSKRLNSSSSKLWATTIS